MRFSPICILALTTIFSAALGQAPGQLSFQGYVTDSGGTPFDDPGVSMTFKLYEGSTAIWSETQSSVQIEGGIFNVLLGSVVPLDTIRFNRPLSLGIKVGADPEISPRTPLAGAAYAKALPGLFTFNRTVGSNESYNVIGGANHNLVGADIVGATISGGGGYYVGAPYPNSVLGNFGAVGGGRGNIATGRESTVAGGLGNGASGNIATVGGGQDNVASAFIATVGGGSANLASGNLATVAGGLDNIASGGSASVGGGHSNEATGDDATVPGGSDNSARGETSFAAGQSARAIHDGTFVWNDRSITSGNDSLLSTGVNQFLVRAAGGVGIGTNVPRAMLTLRGPDERIFGPSLLFQGEVADQFESGRIRFVEGTATTNHRGAYIHYDGSNTGGNRLHIGTHDTGDTLGINDVNVITIERSGGNLGIKREDPAYPLHVGTTTSDGAGAHVTTGGVWTNGSSRTFKTNFRDIDRQEILDRLASIPITEWEYIESDEGRHVGPVAEDFYDAFGLGDENRYIGTIDADGISMAAIQRLYELVKQQQAFLSELQAENLRMRAAMERAGIK